MTLRTCSKCRNTGRFCPTCGRAKTKRSSCQCVVRAKTCKADHQQAVVECDACRKTETLDVGQYSTAVAYRALPRESITEPMLHLCFTCHSEFEQRLTAHRAVLLDQMMTEKAPP